MYLLDTNVLSEALKMLPDRHVLEWLESHQSDSLMSALTLAEMARGAELLPDGKRKSELQRKVRFLQEDYAESIVPLDSAVAWEWARYSRRVRDAGFQTSVIDSLIAATALAHSLTLVSRNVSHFPLVSVINPFSG
jgi:toxin FitB